MYWVYILKSDKTGKFYIGSTSNLTRRLEEHNSGQTKSLLYQRPLTLVFKQKFGNLSGARVAELMLKKMKSRTVLERIVKEGVFRKKIN